MTTTTIPGTLGVHDVEVEYCRPTTRERILPDNYNTRVTAQFTDERGRTDRYVLLCHTRRTPQQGVSAFSVEVIKTISRRAARHWFWPLDSFRVCDGTTACPTPVLDAAMHAVQNHVINQVTHTV